MHRQNHHPSSQSIEKKDENTAKKCVNYTEDEDDLLRIIAQIIVEIILKETADDYKRRTVIDKY